MHWGQAWATRSGEIASSFEARLQTVDQGENLFVVRPWSTVHCTLHCTVHCTVTVHWLQHLSWALQTLQQPDKVTLQCCMPLIGTSHSYRPLIGQHVFFLFRIWWNYVFNAKSYKNRVQFQKNDTWKINGRQSEWTNSLINEMMCLLESITDKLFTLINMNGLKSYWTYQWSRFIFNVLNWWILIKNCSDNAICNTKYEMFNQVELTIIITPLPHKS